MSTNEINSCSGKVRNTALSALGNCRSCIADFQMEVITECSMSPEYQDA